MKKMLSLFTLIFTACSNPQYNVKEKSLHEFIVKDIDGKEFKLDSLKGKTVLVVNVASKCGLTKQYTDLQKLYEKYKGQNFVIVGFPANDFMGQEPGSSEEIATFCQKNYGVTFTMMEKVDVKGKNQSAVYKWLTSKDENGVLDGKVSWNFEKFLIDENGNLVLNLEPKTSPVDDQIINWVSGK